VPSPVPPEKSVTVSRLDWIPPNWDLRIGIAIPVTSDKVARITGKIMNMNIIERGRSSRST